MLAEILGGGGLIALVAFGLKMATLGREVGRLEQRLVTVERDQVTDRSDAKVESVSCRDERKMHGERLAKMHGEIQHTRADVSRALADKG